MNDIKGNSDKVIAVCYSGYAPEYQEIVCNGLIEYARELGNVSLLFYTCANKKLVNSTHDAGEMSIFRLVNFENIDGVIILAQTIKDKRTLKSLVARSNEHNLPCVCFESSNENCANISFNAYQAVYQITTHLITQHHCQKINFMGGSRKDIESLERRNAYMNALSDNGISIDRNRLGQGFWWSDTAEKEVDRWFEEGREFDAVVCANDVMALAVIRAVQRHDKRVPEDIKVTGFDNSNEGKYYTPGLTTVDYLLGKSSKFALDVVLGNKEYRNYMLQAVPKYRASCGCCDCENADFNKIHRDMYETIDFTYAFEQHMFRQTSRIIEQPSIETSLEVLRSYLNRAYTRRMWLCVNSDFFNGRVEDLMFNEMNIEYQHDFSDKMKVIGFKYDDKVSVGGEFDKSELIPDYENELPKCRNLMFIPLHVNDIVIGYIAKEHYDNYVMDRWYSFASNVANALLSIKQKNDFRLVNDRLSQMYITDPLTLLLNRRGFYLSLKDMYKGFLKRGNEGLMAFAVEIDMDGLKTINDVYGHDEGDSSITTVAESIKKAALTSQISARFGGDEFVVAGFYRNGKADSDFENRLNEILKEYNRNSGKPYKVEVSTGVQTGECHSFDDVDNLLKKADELMYEHKLSKRTCNVRHSPRK